MSMFFGLDFGNSSIKAVQSNPLGSKASNLLAVGLVQNPAGSVDFLNKAVCEKLAPAVKQLIGEAGIRDKRAVVSIPESKVYSKIVMMPAMSEAELSSAVAWEAEQFVPVPVDEVEIDYSIVKKVAGREGGILVYLVAAPKKLLQAMVDFLLSIGIEPIAIESEMVAVSRALTFGGIGEGSSLLVHIGALSSVMGIVEEESLMFSHYLNTGGVALTRAVSQSLSLPIAQAEEYKRTYGMDPKQLEGKVREGLLVVMEGMANEMQKAMEYHATENGSQVRRIILSGGGAYMPDLGAYLGEKFAGIEVVLGDPFSKAKARGNLAIPQERAAYVVAAGLSLRTF